MSLNRRRNHQEAEASKSRGKAQTNTECNADFEPDSRRTAGEDNSGRHDSDMRFACSNIRSIKDASPGNVTMAYEEVDVPEQNRASQDECMHLHSSKARTKPDKYAYFYANRKIPHIKAKQNDLPTPAAPEGTTGQVMYDSLSKPTVECTGANIPHAENYNTIYDVRSKSSNDYVNSIQPGLDGAARADYDVTYSSTSRRTDSHEQACFVVLDRSHSHKDVYDELKLQKV